MVTNVSDITVMLIMEPLALTTFSIYPAFVFGTLTYVIIVFCNLMVLTAIGLNRRLHNPMFILLFNMTVNDMMGTTAFFPQMLLSILTQNRSISYTACYIQALLTHMYGGGSLLILTAMAYDRYVAICRPLRYNSIMTPTHLIRLIIMIWVLNIFLMMMLLGLLLRFEICRTTIVDMYCNNPSLLKLICEDTRLNNYYGLALIAFYQGLSAFVVGFTYLQILLTCVMNKQSDAKSKAIQTCGTHLVVFLFLECNSCFALTAHRFESVSPFLRRAFGVSVMVFPPLVNPLIYGLKTKEIRQSFRLLFKRNAFS
ncbi:putative gustatory receptor clone PTE03 [Hypomesus transpacificus]|uniref:putative gustatory receptor clone PTE03 n=1 Tax=Hypomesus transpacificus TaxID=137520 RepID=UPI001F086E45|nr:putative gustatory receptor clone PTE03 [Hypomesus transpacificus]